MLAQLCNTQRSNYYYYTVTTILISSRTAFRSDLSPASSHKFNVAHLEDSRQQLEHISDLLLGEFHDLQRFLQHSVDKVG